jgi:hypothetical protein
MIFSIQLNGDAEAFPGQATESVGVGGEIGDVGDVGDVEVGRVVVVIGRR